MQQNQRMNQMRQCPLLLAVSAGLLFSGAAFGQLTVQAGAPTDVYHGQPPQCVFSGSTALNAPCTTVYTDATVKAVPPTLFYEVGAALTYTLPAPVGVCDVALLTWEPNKAAAGQRVFSVLANGISSGPLDLFALVGLAQPYTLTLPGVPVANGQIVVQLLPSVGNPVVSTLSVQNCVPPPAPVVGISGAFVCPGGTTLTLQSGLVTFAQCTSPCAGLALCVFADHEVPAGTADGTNTIFTLKVVPVPFSANVYVGGQFQQPAAYTLVGNVLTFTAPPPLGSIIQVDYRA